MNNSTTLMIIIGFALFGLMFGLSFCDNGETDSDSPEAYEVTVDDLQQPQVRTLAPLERKAPGDRVLCKYIIYVEGTAKLMTTANHTAQVPVPFPVAEKVELDSLPLLSQTELEELALTALPNGGSPGPEWAFDSWLRHPTTHENAPEVWLVDRQCTKDLQKEQPTKVSR